jgi:hypothetical protein
MKLFEYPIDPLLFGITTNSFASGATPPAKELTFLPAAMLATWVPCRCPFLPRLGGTDFVFIYPFESLFLPQPVLEYFEVLLQAAQH